MLRSAAMLRPVIVSALIAAGLCSVAHADVYRWVDDKGEPHYSDRWVPGSELIKSDKPHPQTPTPTLEPDSDAGPAPGQPIGSRPCERGSRQTGRRQDA